MGRKKKCAVRVKKRGKENGTEEARQDELSVCVGGGGEWGRGVPMLYSRVTDETALMVIVIKDYDRWKGEESVWATARLDSSVT